LLAVVLIVALVSVALLGFFPGMASDAQITQSQMYWQSASPIAISEIHIAARIPSTFQYPYIRLKNTGAYPIRLTGIVGGDGVTITQFDGDMCGATTPGGHLMSDYYTLAPGEEKYLSYSGVYVTCNQFIIFKTSGSSGNQLGGAASLCQNSSASPGFLQYNTFGFVYTEYIDGQTISKKQMGAKPLMVKCDAPVS
jgi:hypothetical protein